MTYISRITMTNFKSFKRISLPIPRGFTAIVGPNGSGKSNIIDGICFVLGRSSAKSLRAERFSDLIFNGGKDGKSQGEAEVSLYLDNAGGEIPIGTKEVKLTRSIDSSGGSVYRLNGKRASRQEILDVLSAAKIYPDGHNIVLQGDVTSIIKMDPVERRGIIDEIAGIAEYDDKKRKAFRELEKVSENVSTVEVLLSEVGGQLGKLEKEKNDALRHEFLKSEIRRSRGRMLYSAHLETSRSMEKILAQLQKEEERSEKLNKFLNLLRLKSEVKRKELESTNTEVTVKENAEKFEIFREIEKLQNEIKSRDEKLEAAESELRGLESRYGECKSEIVGVFGETRDYGTRNEKLLAEEMEIEGKTADLKSKLDAEYRRISGESAQPGKQDDFARLVSRLDEQRKRLLESERESVLLGERKSSMEEMHKNLSNELTGRKRKLEELHETQKALAKEKVELERRIEKTEQRKRELADGSMELRKELGRLETTLQLKNQELAKLEVKCKAMEDAAARRVSFSDAVNFVLKMRDSMDGIYGTISELGTSKPEFSRAVEAAAGRGMQFIVVDTDATAEKCIARLKENKIGRATFLPMNRLKDFSRSPRAAEIAKKSYGFVVDLVDFDKKFSKAFLHVFRNTVAVKDIAFARSAGIGEARMVTLDGDIAEESGVMSGGFYKSSTGFDEANALRVKLTELEKEVKRLVSERAAAARKNAEAADELERIRSAEAEDGRNLEMLSERLKAAKASIDELVEKIAEIEAAASKKFRELGEISKKIQENESGRKELSAVVERLSAERSTAESELHGAAVGVLTQVKELESQIRASELESADRKNQRHQNETRVNEILKVKFNELKNELLKIFLTKKDIRRKIDGMSSSRAELEKSLAELKGRESGVVSEIKELKSRIELLTKGIKKIGDKVEALGEELGKINKKSETARIEKARLESKLEGLADGLKVYADLSFDATETVDPVELEKKIAEMDFEMKSLEPINMRAIDDFEVVKGKFEGLDKRIAKLREEKEAILKLVGEIEGRKKAVFMEVFENVAANFRRIFSQLSAGGTAELLLDAENPLDGGLHIQAKPAGKNPQYVELMSGGEKTLTGLSFIFAIQCYQPAPFYILDEIDMFLDDDNTRKVAELIRESSKAGQFIVVSLRDDLMSSAEQLFGVSSENGVSKIIGVELEEVAA